MSTRQLSQLVVKSYILSLNLIFAGLSGLSAQFLFELL